MILLCWPRPLRCRSMQQHQHGVGETTPSTDGRSRQASKHSGQPCVNCVLFMTPATLHNHYQFAMSSPWRHTHSLTTAAAAVVLVVWPLLFTLVADVESSNLDIYCKSLRIQVVVTCIRWRTQLDHPPSLPLIGCRSLSLSLSLSLSVWTQAYHIPARHMTAAVCDALYVESADTETSNPLSIRDSSDWCRLRVRSWQVVQDMIQEPANCCLHFSAPSVNRKTRLVCNRARLCPDEMQHNRSETAPV